MKLFHFYRNEDHSGVSGAGPVVEGVQFTNGWCAIRWISSMSSVCFYQSIEEVKAIHSHGGKTEIVIHDFEPLSKRRTLEEGQRMDLLMDIIDEAARITNLAEDPDTAPGEVRHSLEQIRFFLDSLEKSLGLDLDRSA